MDIVEKIQLIVDAINGKEKIAVIDNVGRPYELDWNSAELCFETHPVRVGYTVDFLIRANVEIAVWPKQPLLSTDQCAFLRHFPTSWWLCRDISSIYLFSQKPEIRDDNYFSQFRCTLHLDKVTPDFNVLEPLDCFTIAELLKRRDDFDR